VDFATVLLRAVHMKRVKKSQSSTHLADNLRRGIVNRSERIQIDFYNVTGVGVPLPTIQTYIELNATENQSWDGTGYRLIANRDYFIQAFDKN